MEKKKMNNENVVIVYDNSKNRMTDLKTYESLKIKPDFQNEYLEAVHRAYNYFFDESQFITRQLFEKNLPDPMIEEADLLNERKSFVKNKITAFYKFFDFALMARETGYFCGKEFQSLDEMRECFFGNFLTFLTEDEKNLPYWEEFMKVTKWYKDFNLSEIKKKDYIAIKALFKRSEDRLSLDMARITKAIHVTVLWGTDSDYEKIISGADLSPFANNIRYIYLVPELKNKVKFYKGEEEIDAPWKQQSEVWGACIHRFNSGLTVDHDYVDKGIKSGDKGKPNKLGEKKDYFNLSIKKLLIHDANIEPNQHYVNGFGEVCRLKKEREQVEISFSNEYCQAFLEAVEKSLMDIEIGEETNPFVSNSSTECSRNSNIQSLLSKYFTKKQMEYPFWDNFFN
ncbi:hypothetical protein CUM72_01570 [Enterococcus durans]|nr:hypothetical protein CUM72_01570 [Enterococcus durans]TKN16807.1 hypothetical protein DVW83_09740 [Enterococcus sp. VV15]